MPPSRSALFHQFRLTPLALLFLLLLHSRISHAESHTGSHAHHHHPGVELRRQDLEVSRASLTDDAGPWNAFKSLLDAQPGEVRAGMASLKSYLLKFGYIVQTNAPPAGTPFTEEFDNITQTAVMQYQRSFSLPVSGRLDVATLTQMIIPRCGREDVINGTLLMLQRGLTNLTIGSHLGVQHYSSFPGSPRWQKKNLTYAINTASISAEVSLGDTEIAIDTAFAKWAAAITLTFTRIPSLVNADITVSFDSLEHGDGNAFDGPLGVLAHAYAPIDGRLHFDKAESWTINVQRSRATSQFDMVSVAVHEIGHLLGLEHSNVVDAIMYPSISPQTSKQALSADDVAGAQALYGPNPSYTPGSSTPGTTLGNQGAAVASWRRLREREMATVTVLSGLCLLLVSLVS